jgi:hypothetical protein
MTIRRSVDIAAINRDLDNFKAGLEVMSPGAFTRALTLDEAIEMMLDDIEQSARVYDLKSDKCDAFREVHALLFDMMRRANPELENEIVQLIAIGEGADA